MSLRVIITEGTRADCKEACALIDGFTAENLLADRGYDTNEILAKVAEISMIATIPPKRNRKELGSYDEHLYKVRHLVENAFLHLIKMERHSNSLCKKNTVISSRSPNQVYIPLG